MNMQSGTWRSSGRERSDGRSGGGLSRQRLPGTYGRSPPSYCPWWMRC